ncbi:MAG: porin [Rhodocyclaceae bacterium]|nr:porin [Rhodocyclaceae bacterium]
MQKKLIALAIAGLSSAAFAQSNVTIYGVADMGFESVSATGATAANSDFGSRSRVSSTSSYIGFKGTEGLGNGLAVAWQIENGLQLDNAAGGVWNNRDSYVGLAGGFGTVAMGNLTGPTRALGAKFDVNAGATGIGANTALLGKGALQGAGASAFDQRITNAIAYISPNMGGFSGVVGYSTGLQNTVNGTALAGQENSAAGASVKGNTAWTLGLNYEGGPVYVGYAYTQVKTTNSGIPGVLPEPAGVNGLLGALAKAKDNRLGAMYNFGSGTVGLLWDQPTYTTAGAAGVDLKQTIYYIPVTFTVGAGKIIAQYGHANDVTNTTATNAKHYEIGYEYSLSKRTMLKAVYSAVKNDSNASDDFLYGVSGANSTATTGAMSAGADPRGVSFGLRHSF